MKLKSLYSALLLLTISSLTWFSCKKNIKDESVVPTPTQFSIPAATPVTGSVSGVVVDENNTPVDGAEVRIGSNTFTTTANGAFVFKNISLDKYISTITINKAGYFKGIRSFSASATMNYVSIKLIPKSLAGTVSSDNPAAVNLSNGSSIALQANSIVIKSSGAAYTGQVKVFAAYIDPTSTDMSTMVPGSLMGEDATSLYALQSTGMIAVDLESPSGEALQLVSSKPASIKMPIPASLLSKAPNTIDTWSLDDRGVWTKEGTATRNGDSYDMQVTHFSFWNCDVPAVSTYLNIHVQDQDGNALANTLVSLTVPNSTSWWSTTYGWTDSLGNVGGIIPAGVELELAVFSGPYNCNAPMYTQTVGPFTTSSAITITATFSNTSEITISGTATDCNNQPLANGTAIINTSPYEYYYATITNGSYSIDIIHCSVISSINVTAVDITSGAQANSGSVAVSGNTVTVPALQACGGGTQNAEFTFSSAQGNCLMGTFTGTYTAGVALNGSSAVTVFVDVTVAGSYNITTSTVNGITFNASGTFTTAGPQQAVALVASGTPVSGGSYTFTTQAAGVTGCPFNITVNYPPAVIDLNSCTNVSVNGTYMAGSWLDPAGSNNITVTLNVTSPGQYYLTAASNNGYSFQDSGTVTAPGLVTFVLYGSGMPNVPGVDNVILMSSGMSGCTIPITVLANPFANFTFMGGQGTCSGATLAGTYTAGVPLLGPSNTIAVTVEVTNTGNYDLFTTDVNGFNFSASGTFTTLGVQTVVLTASGTPTSSGVYTYQIMSTTGAPGCIFTVQVN